jgi:large subunit ribosomal protein L25
VTADATALPEHLELDITGKRAGTSLSAGDVPLPAGTELAQDTEHVMVAFLGVVSEEQLEAELAASEEELGAGAAGAAADEDEVQVGSESDATGEGDVVGETEAPKSETPAE